MIDVPLRPVLPGPEGRRWNHTLLRERLLSGDWSEALDRAIERHMGRTRRRGMGAVDMSSNVLRAVATQLAVLYDRPPKVLHAGDPDGAAPLIESESGILARAGLWQTMRYVQRMVIGLNEALVSVRISADGLPLYRPVSPASVIATSTRDAPDMPATIQELRLRAHPSGSGALWTWELYEPAISSFRVLSAESGGTNAEDLTALFTGDPAPLVGDRYPYLDRAGVPILPYVLWHVTRSPFLWNPYYSRELVEGSLSAAVGWSFWAHCLRDASWPQRYTINCRPVGGALVDTDLGRRHEIVTDPATLLALEVIEAGEGQPVAGQFSAGSDPAMLADCLTKYEARLASHFGLSPADIQRHGGNARSGYAISITNAGKRAVQAGYAENARRSDLLLIETTARLLNAATGSNYPESGYEIYYQGVPQSAEELDAQRRHVLELLAAGLIDRVEALMLLRPGLSRAEAIRRIDAIRRLNLSTSP